MPTEPSRSSRPKRSRRGGAPRKADHRTGADPAFARAVAAALPGVEATSHRGSATFTGRWGVGGGRRRRRRVGLWR
jgi:hypothetical protein